MLKSKKGFTLVELTIVIAVTAVVVTMVCGFMIAYQYQSARIVQSNDAMSDINTVKKYIDDWLIKSNAAANDYTVSETGIIVGENCLNFSSGELSVNGSVVKLNTVTACTFSEKNSNGAAVICCSVTADAGIFEKKVQLYFNVSGNATRVRL